MADREPILPISVEHARLALAGDDHPDLMDARAAVAAIMIVPEDDEIALRDLWSRAASALEIRRNFAGATPGKVLSAAAGDLVRLCDGSEAAGALSPIACTRYATGEQSAQTLRCWLDPRIHGAPQSACPSVTEAKQLHARSVALGAKRRREMNLGIRDEKETIATLDQRWGKFRSVAHLYAAHLDLAKPEARCATSLPCVPAGFVAFLLRADLLRRAALFHSLTLAETLWKLGDDVVEELLDGQEFDFGNPTPVALVPLGCAAVK